MAPKNTVQLIDPDLFVDEASSVALPTGGFVVDFAAIPMVQELLPKGDYNATIVHAEPAMSKANNPMIKLRWRIDGGAYDQRSVFDALVFTAPTGDWNKDFPLRKIKLLVEAIGSHVAPNGVIDPESLLGESCVLSVTLKASSGINPETGEQYPEQNNVATYKPAGSLRTVDDLL